ncbi:hypothetical protein WSM22_22370 [Cytophagales bacterium WSM2-2]|nr:hypothetical protein WSM22_22370 [Cytophagales bacterium WSM2-2]
MKTILVIVAAILFVGCSPQNTTPVVPALTNSAFDSIKAQLLKKGTFIGLDGPTSGTAKVYDQSGIKYITLDPFVSHSGPDLYVYLSKDVNAADYIRVGKLQAVTGRQIYSVPGNPSIVSYNYVHIWCQAYSVDFAHAEIK